MTGNKITWEGLQSVVREALFNKKVTNHEICLVFYIFFSKKKNLTISEFVNITNFSKSSIQRCLKNLEEHKLVRRYARKGFANYYYIRPPKRTPVDKSVDNSKNNIASDAYPVDNFCKTINIDPPVTHPDPPVTYLDPLVTPPLHMYKNTKNRFLLLTEDKIGENTRSHISANIKNNNNYENKKKKIGFSFERHKYLLKKSKEGYLSDDEEAWLAAFNKWQDQMARDFTNES